MAEAGIGFFCDSGSLVVVAAVGALQGSSLAPWSLAMRKARDHGQRSTNRRAAVNFFRPLRVEALEERALLTITPHLLADINLAPVGVVVNGPIVELQGVAYFPGLGETNGVELWRSDGTTGGTFVVRDIVPGIGSSYPSQLTVVDGTLFFRANDGVHGVELWKSNGSAGGTELVKDILAGSADSYPKYLTNVGGTLFFTANDGSNGVELWKSAGDEADTIMVENIRAGNPGATPQALTNVNGKLFFSANDGINGNELWKSDGTVGGTEIVKDVLTGSVGSYPASITNVNGTVFFSAFTTANGRELWKNAGADTSLVANINPSGWSSPRDLTNVNGTLFFVADDGTHGFDLWKSSGTSAGTALVKDFGFSNYGPIPDYARNLVNVNGTLYFRLGNNLFKSNGTDVGTVLVHDIRPGYGSYPYGLTNVNGTLYFTANDGTHGFELWKAGGSIAGAELVKDVVPGALPSSPTNIASVNGKLFFGAVNRRFENELWTSDGTAAGTTLIPRDTFSTASAIRDKVVVVGGYFYFAAIDSVHGYELWKSDGTAAGTVLLKDINPGLADSYPRYLTNVNGALFFVATDSVSGTEVWKSDGTASGTVVVQEIGTGAVGSYPKYLTNANGSLFFVANDGTRGRELYKSPASGPGAQLVKDIVTSGADPSGNPTSLTEVNGVLFFSAGEVTNGIELWKSDGTEAGTRVVKNIASNAASSSPNRLTNVNGTLFFVADDQVTGDNIWKSDGTSGGTTLVKDIRPGNSGTDAFVSDLLNVSGTLFFAAIDGVHGKELWRSDGTTGGTQLVADIWPGNGASYPRYLADVNGTLYFTADNGSSGHELWSSGGTAETTKMVKEVLPGIASAGLRELRNINGTLFFRGYDATNGVEPWTSDGTSAGTVIAANIAPDAFGSLPYGFQYFNGLIVFLATDTVHGSELWSAVLHDDGVAPTVIGTLPALPDGVLTAGTTSLGVNFSEAMLRGANSANYELRSTGPDGLLGNVDDTIVPVTTDYGGTTSTIKFAGLAAGVYRLTVKETIIDAAGNLLDGDGSGTAGGDYVRDFVVGANSLALGFRADLTNASDFTEPNSATYTNLKFSNVALNDGAITVLGDGTLRAERTGLYTVTGQFDVIVTNGLPYATSRVLLNGVSVQLSLTGREDGIWNMNRFSVVLALNAGDTVQIQALPSQISAMDNAQWSSIHIVCYQSVHSTPAALGFRADLTNASDFTGPNGSTYTNLKFTDVALNQGAITVLADGTLRAERTGLYSVFGQFDVIVTNGTRYATSRVLVNGEVVQLSLTGREDGIWNMNTFSVVLALNAGDTIQIQALPSDIASMDNGEWSSIHIVSFQTVASTPAALGFRADLTNAADFMAPNSDTYTNLKFTDVGVNDGAITVQADGTLRAEQSGLYTVFGQFDVIVTDGTRYAQCQVLVNGEIVQKSLVGREDGVWNMNRFSVVLALNAGDTVQIQALPSEIASMDNAEWSSIHIVKLDTKAPNIIPLLSANQFVFDVAGSGRGTGQLANGSNNTFDGLNRLQVGGTEFAATTGALVEDQGQTVNMSAQVIAGLQVKRKVTVPAVGSEDFARTLDVFTNPTASPISTTVKIVGNLGSDTATTVFSTSDGDNIVEATDQWIGTDDADGSGTPAIIHYVHGPLGLKPSSVEVVGDNVVWKYDLTVAAGQTVRLASFTVLSETRAGAQAAAAALVAETGFGAESTAFLSASEVASLANFQFNQPPTFAKGADKSATDEDGTQTILSWAKNISPGPASEAGQLLDFIVTADNPSLFSTQPAINASTGDLTYTPRANTKGTSTLTVKLHDNAGGNDTSATQTFNIAITKLHVWHNALNGLDVTGPGGVPDGAVVAADALEIINFINGFGPGPVPTDGRATGPYIDVNGDGSVAPKDALDVINEINASGNGEGDGMEFRVLNSEVKSQKSEIGTGVMDEVLELLAVDSARHGRRRR